MGTVAEPDDDDEDDDEDDVCTYGCWPTESGTLTQELRGREMDETLWG